MRETEIDLQKESPFFVYFSFAIVIMKLILARVLEQAQKIYSFFVLVWKEKWSAEIVICYYDMIWGDDDSVFFYNNKKPVEKFGYNWSTTAHVRY